MNLNLNSHFCGSEQNSLSEKLAKFGLFICKGCRPTRYRAGKHQEQHATRLKGQFEIDNMQHCAQIGLYLLREKLLLQSTFFQFSSHPHKKKEKERKKVLFTPNLQKNKNQKNDSVTVNHHKHH